jgi:Cell division protein ZapA.
MSDEMLITLEVIPGGKRYPVNIDADDEELVREAARQLRLKFNAYKQVFSEADLSESDLMAMMAIDIATSHLRMERKNDTVPFTTKIQQLNEKLKDYLKEQ